MSGLNEILEYANYGVIDLLNYLDNKNIYNSNRDELLLAALIQALFDKDKQKNNKLLENLMEAGANPNIKCRNKYYAIDITKQIKIKDLINDWKLRYKLYDAVVSNNVLEVQKLLYQNVIPHRENGNLSPLLVAVKNNNPTIVNLLLNYGSCPYTKDNLNKTAYNYTENDYIIKALDIARNNILNSIME